MLYTLRNWHDADFSLASPLQLNCSKLHDLHRFVVKFANLVGEVGKSGHSQWASEERVGGPGQGKIKSGGGGGESQVATATEQVGGEAR